ncbi:cupin domain-containing protein [Aliikangiella coralliicola]|uniref:Cupin domain-containing protein n=1 Tax=Aliikangiella coralliicola TaxID=2592383 RepID=A0A545UEL8_9GAMM|nr:cupin domain-containing protein [Aliikangiella coralliicola]TQV87921.1 cupin domain-containing protein [Aliikangiella coralliicola]
MKRLTVNNALTALDKQEKPFLELFKHGSLMVEIYKPEKIDRQQPHSRDEIYVIASGSGYFINGDSREKFETGEVLFVPAGIEHRFEDFTDDFSTWVFFYGPEGGESN